MEEKEITLVEKLKSNINQVFVGKIGRADAGQDRGSVPNGGCLAMLYRRFCVCAAFCLPLTMLWTGTDTGGWIRWKDTGLRFSET